MFRLPVVALALGVSLLRADTFTQISIDFHEFDQPLVSPADVRNYYSGGSGIYGTNGLPGPDYGLYDATPSTSFPGHWVAIGFGGAGSATFLYHGLGNIGASRGMFNSISMLIKGGFPGDAPDAFPISVLDASGNLLGSARVGYLTDYIPISIAFSGEASKIVFGDANYFDADYFSFTDLVTYVPMADAPASAPEPRYAIAMGMLLLALGAVRMRRMRRLS
jgi:hypothetical protein